MNKPAPTLAKDDWKASFEDVRLAQHLRFRSLSAKQKIAALEDAVEIVRRVSRSREQGSGPLPRS